jgi:hypothetical protein
MVLFLEVPSHRCHPCQHHMLNNDLKEAAQSQRECGHGKPWQKGVENADLLKLLMWSIMQVTQSKKILSQRQD